MYQVMNYRSEKIAKLEAAINYSFKNREYLYLALTHSSFANENRVLDLQSNERLEFLGDSVLNIIVSDRLFRDFTLPEGEMTKKRSLIVCEASLERGAEKISLGEYIYIGKGEESTGGRKRASILADAFEALIGAVYLDGGLGAASELVFGFLWDEAESASAGHSFRDYKTVLQERVQSLHDVDLTYEITGETGPDHDKTYTSAVSVGGKLLGTGQGRTKKEAEQNAAREALQKEDFHE